MKKLILIALTLSAIGAVPLAHAEGGPVNLLISGGQESNSIHVSLSPDGRDYAIVSSAPLEAGGNLCDHPEERPTELLCEAGAIAGFEVNVGGGADFVIFTSDIPVPVTIRGGPGRDRLTGGSVSDKIVGGADNDVLTGRRGDDWMLGGPGRDGLFGGSGDDQLRGGPEKDTLVGGPGQDTVVP